MRAVLTTLRGLCPLRVLGYTHAMTLVATSRPPDRKILAVLTLHELPLS